MALHTTKVCKPEGMKAAEVCVCVHIIRGLYLFVRRG